MFVVFDTPPTKPVKSVPGEKTHRAGPSPDAPKPAPSLRGARGSHGGMRVSETAPPEHRGWRGFRPTSRTTSGVARDAYLRVRFVAPASPETTAPAREACGAAGALEAVGSHPSVPCPQEDAEQPGTWKQIPRKFKPTLRDALAGRRGAPGLASLCRNVQACARPTPGPPRPNWLARPWLCACSRVAPRTAQERTSCPGSSVHPRP